MKPEQLQVYLEKFQAVQWKMTNTVQADISSMKRILDRMKNIPIKKIVLKDPTFMDLSGYPHYENVCSNILSFYLTTDAVHGLGDLMLQALLTSAGMGSKNAIVTNEVEREVMTDRGNRMDLVIHSDDYLVGVENKIYTAVNNNLQDYAQWLERNANGRRVIKILLSLDQKAIEEAGFVSVTYESFFNEMEIILGRYWTGGNPKYLMCLQDFVQTIRSLTKGDDSMNDEVMDFFKENLEDTNQFIQTINETKKALRQEVQKLLKMIHYDETRFTQFYWRDNNILLDDLVFDMQVDDAVVAIDTIITPAGWEIRIWLRKRGRNVLRSKIELLDWVNKKEIGPEHLIEQPNIRNVYCKQFERKDINQVAISLQQILDLMGSGS